MMSFDRKPSSSRPATPRPPLPRSNPNTPRGDASSSKPTSLSSQQKAPKLEKDTGVTRLSATDGSSTQESRPSSTTCAAELEYQLIADNVVKLRSLIVKISKENTSLEQTIADLQTAHALQLNEAKEVTQVSRASLEELVAKESSKVQSHSDQLAAAEVSFSNQQERTEAAKTRLLEVEAKLAHFRNSAAVVKRQREESEAEGKSFDIERKRCLHRMAALESQRKKHEANLDALKEQTAREVALEEEAKKELAQRLAVVAGLDSKIKNLLAKR